MLSNVISMSKLKQSQIHLNFLLHEYIILCFCISRCVNREYGYYGDPDDPQKYFVCLPYTKQRQGKSLGGKLGLGRKWEFTCGPGTTFSEKHLTCV